MTWPAMLPAAIPAEALRAALAEAGVEVPADDDRLFAGRLSLSYLPKGLGIAEIVRAERSHHQLYNGMVEYEDQLQRERQSKLVRGIKPAPRPWPTSAQSFREKAEITGRQDVDTGRLQAAGPKGGSTGARCSGSRGFESHPGPSVAAVADQLVRLAEQIVAPVVLADLENACRYALSHGWTKAEVVSVLRAGGATWKNHRITGCPEQIRAAVFVALTTLDLRRKEA